MNTKTGAKNKEEQCNGGAPGTEIHTFWSVLESQLRERMQQCFSA